MTEELQKVLGEITTISYDEKGKILKVVVEPNSLKDAARSLKAFGFDHVKSVTAVDNMAQKKIVVLYHISSYSNEELQKYIVQLECEVPRDKPEVGSLSDVWPSAVFHERETYEMFGVVFKGHEDLRPILLPEELLGKWPMRKDFRG